MAKQQEYNNITFAGRVNVGKSSLLNLLSGQDGFAIVDEQPGTTSDTVITRMEIHDLGPIKLFDTAGMNEYSQLGEKKKQKTYEAIEESDLVLVVMDLLKHKEHRDFSIEKEIIERALNYKKQVLLVYNIFESLTEEALQESIKWAEQKIGYNFPSISLSAVDVGEQIKFIDFIKNYFKKEDNDIDLIPLKKGSGFVLLNIPMDEETPTLRLLRPQDMAIERLLRKYLTPVLYRMDLNKARTGNKEEEQKFLNIIEGLKNSPQGLKLIITDSQAMDIVDKWTPENVPLTTFSVMMANYMSAGNLDLFIQGIKTFESLKNGDKILIMESCNHDRKCDDIGTKQIPRLIKNKLNLDLEIDFSFGRVLPENLEQYKLVIHCGGCMIDRQKYSRRIIKLNEAGVPITNYGLFLSWVNNSRALGRVVKIFIND